MKDVCKHLVKVLFYFQLLGAPKFHVLAHHVVIGNQVIVRGNGKTLIRTFFDALTVCICSIILEQVAKCRDSNNQLISIVFLLCEN